MPITTTYQSDSIQKRVDRNQSNATSNHTFCLFNPFDVGSREISVSWLSENSNEKRSLEESIGLKTNEQPASDSIHRPSPHTRRRYECRQVSLTPGIFLDRPKAIKPECLPLASSARPSALVYSWASMDLPENVYLVDRSRREMKD